MYKSVYNITKEKKKEITNLYPIQLFTQEFLHTVCVPFEDAEFLSDVPVIVQKL